MRRWAAFLFLFALLLVGLVLNMLRHEHPGRAVPATTEPLEVAALDRKASQASTRTSGNGPERSAPRVAVHGVVTWADGTPAAGVSVTCRSLSARGDRAHSTSGGDGTFSFEEMPSGVVYDIVAVSETAYGERRVPHPDVLSGPVRIVLEDLLYERLEFVDASNQPVPVAGGHGKGTLVVPAICGSEDMKGRERWLPERLREMSRLPDHEIAYLFTRTAAESEKRAARVITVQGYHPVEVPFQPMEVARWPEGRRVRLDRNHSESLTVLHRIEFPTARPPAEWASGSWQDIAVNLTIDPTGRTHFVTRDRPRCRVPAGAAFRLFRSGTVRHLQHDAVPSGDHVLIRPHYPGFAFLDVRYPETHPTVDECVAGASLTGSPGGGPSIYLVGVMVKPGHARFAYVPEGKYRLTLDWFRLDDGPDVPWWEKEDLSIEPGHHEYVAKDRG